jgi:hypothetical protein
MRIRELLEGRNFDDTPFVKHTADKREIDYDLTDDLIHFMHNDDHVYRRHLYPTILDCVDQLKVKRPVKSVLFKGAVEESYKTYINKYPIKELPQQLDEKTCDDICKKLKEDILKHIEDGIYKD